VQTGLGLVLSKGGSNSALRNNWLGKVLSELADGRDIVLVTVTATKGSSPRNAGACMLITADEIWQTIGGGAVEFDIMARARKMLASGDDGWQRQHLKIVLGPDMGQCCGGQMSILLEKFTTNHESNLLALSTVVTRETILAHPLESGPPLLAEPVYRMPAFSAPIMPPQTPLFIYGAGHVSRALLPRLDGLGFDIFLVDIDDDRYPADLGDKAEKLLAKAPEVIAKHAPLGAVHLVMTHSHSLDEAICLELLTKGDFAYLGLIGSKSKRARFAKRLLAAGVAESMLDILVCPIGIDEITGKNPAYVALSIAAQLAISQRLGDDHNDGSWAINHSGFEAQQTV
jgi:xanthine dehydrogenase accessory factor